MKNFQNMIKCSVEKKCMDENIVNVLKMYNLRGEIVYHLLKTGYVPEGYIKNFKIIYKEFSKVFFHKNTIECMKKNCKKNIPNNSKMISKSISYLESILKKVEKRKNNPFAKNHIKIIKTLLSILYDFLKKFNKKYL